MSSGGVFYHFRALRFGKNHKDALWETHRQGVKKFLLNWNPPEKNIVLIGTSGGYSLPESFLTPFHRVLAVEPDPLARLIFSKRIQKSVEWIPKSLSFENFSRFTKTLPDDTAVLFCNLLGQIPFTRIKKVRESLFQAMAGRSWASYHDVLSGENLQFDTELLPLNRSAKLSELKACVYPMISSGTIELNAHQAPELFETQTGIHHLYWQWRILPKRTHLIEGVYHVRS